MNEWPWYADLDSSGLTKPEKRAALYDEQGGACAVCRHALRLVGDHDHGTGLLRGLLCYGCNHREAWRARYPDIGAYLAAPPAAGRGWMWAVPKWWTGYDDRTAISHGITVLQYVTDHPGLGAQREAASMARAMEVLRTVRLAPLEPRAPAELVEPPRRQDLVQPNRRRIRGAAVTIEEAIVALGNVKLPPL